MPIATTPEQQALPGLTTERVRDLAAQVLTGPDPWKALVQASLLDVSAPLDGQKNFTTGAHAADYHVNATYYSGVRAPG